MNRPVCPPPHKHKPNTGLQCFPANFSLSYLKSEKDPYSTFACQTTTHPQTCLVFPTTRPPSPLLTFRLLLQQRGSSALGAGGDARNSKPPLASPVLFLSLGSPPCSALRRPNPGRKPNQPRREKPAFRRAQEPETQQSPPEGDFSPPPVGMRRRNCATK